MTFGAHGWRSITPRAAITWARSAAFQSPGRVGQLDLADDHVRDAIEDLVLVPDVAVERHRIDAELLAEPAHAQGVDALAIGEVDGSPKDALLGQGRPTVRARFQLVYHLTSRRRVAMFTV